MKDPASMRHRIPIRSGVRTSPSSELRGAAIAVPRGAATAREISASDGSRARGNIPRMSRARIASIEIEILHPDPATPGPAWTLLWDGEAATVHPIPGSDAGDPADWGIPDASRDDIDLWRAEGEAAVIEQLLDNFAGGGAEARIVAVHGGDEARRSSLATLRAFAEQHPQCAEEIRRFALGQAESPGYGRPAESPSSAVQAEEGHQRRADALRRVRPDEVACTRDDARQYPPASNGLVEQIS